MLVLPFHNIDPVIFRINESISLNWYGISYLVGILFMGYYGDHLATKSPYHFKKKSFSDFVVWGMIAIVVGGRLGQVIFYDLEYYLQYPLKIFATWKGGMSFHGGIIGAIIAVLIYSRKNSIPFKRFLDIIAVCTPAGLFLGRIANFINGELFGNYSDLPWAMVFPQGGNLPRHPSQIYEALLEGVLLFLILNILYKRYKETPGLVSSAFLLGYGIFRYISEIFRVPDFTLSLGNFVLSGGQILSLPMMIVGLALLIYLMRQRSPSS